MNERNMLMSKIKKYDFALKELNLYLDTHPHCQRALAMFRKYRDLKKACEAEYTEKYGPIIPEQNNSDTHWTWIDDPWPWERR
mgnify:CR=1 FL=1